MGYVADAPGAHKVGIKLGCLAAGTRQHTNCKVEYWRFDCGSTFSGSKLKGNQSISEQAAGSRGELRYEGGGTIDITGNPSVAPSKLPSALQSYASLFANMAIYKIPDPDTSKNGPNDITIGGTSNINFKGTMYLPSANVTFQGNPTINLAGATGCGELIAKSVAFNGNATLNSNGWPIRRRP